MFAGVQAYCICECRKALVSPNGMMKRQPVGVLFCRGATVYAASKAQPNIRRSLRCKLVCSSNGFSHLCVLQGTLISPNEIRQARGVLCRGATVYAASKAQPNIRRSLRAANLFAAAMASRRCVCCQAHLYLQIDTVRQRGVLCRGATVYAASRAMPNIRRDSGI